MLGTGKKKRVLPEWMRSPLKDNSSEKISAKKQRSIKNFFDPKESPKKSVDIDVFDFGIGCESETKDSDMKYNDKPTLFIMSPAELEEVAKLILNQN